MNPPPRLYRILPEPHAAFRDRLRRALETEDRADLATWLGLGLGVGAGASGAPPDRPLFVELLADGPLRRALRAKLLADCLQSIYEAPTPLFDDHLRESAGDDPGVKALIDDPSLPFYLRAPGEFAGRAAGETRRRAAAALADENDLAAFVAALKQDDGEVVLAVLDRQ